MNQGIYTAKLIINAYHRSSFVMGKLRKISSKPCLGLNDETEIESAIKYCIAKDELGPAGFIALYCNYFEELSNSYFEQYGKSDCYCAFLSSKYYLFKGDKAKHRYYLEYARNNGSILAEIELMKLNGEYNFPNRIGMYFKRLFLVSKNPISPKVKSVI